MLERIMEKVLLVLNLPTRNAIRYELGKQTVVDSKGIKRVLPRGATESTADYGEEHMRNVDSVSSNLELLTTAFKKADLQDDKHVCEFRVYSENTISHIASVTSQTV